LIVLRREAKQQGKVSGCMTIEILRLFRFQETIWGMSDVLREATEQIKEREVITLMNEYREEKDRKCQ
jgi:hypothetical protein